MFNRLLSLFLIANVAFIAVPSYTVFFPGRVNRGVPLWHSAMKDSVEVKSYEDFKENTAIKMYNCQPNMTDFDKYKDIVFKFFDKAEKQLAVGPAIVAHYATPEVHIFMCYLIDYQIAMFNQVIVKGHKVEDINEKSVATCLKSSIEKMKQSFRMESLNVNEEFSKLSDLVFEGNSYYYKQLSLGTQAKIGAARFACSGKIGI